MTFLSSVGELIFSIRGPSITRGGILAGLVLLYAGLSWVVSLVGSGEGLLGWGGLVPCFFFFLWTNLKLSSSCEESVVLGLMAGVEVIRSESLWVGAGSSGSLVVGNSVRPGGLGVELWGGWSLPSWSSFSWRPSLPGLAWLDYLLTSGIPWIPLAFQCHH